MQPNPLPETLETRTASVSISKSGIVCVKIREGLVQSVEDARANIQAATRAAANVRSPILVDISGAEPLEPEVRRVYMGDALVEAFFALALCIDGSRLSVMMANVYLRVARLAIPTRIFTDGHLASEWLLERTDGDG